MLRKKKQTKMLNGYRGWEENRGDFFSLSFYLSIIFYFFYTDHVSSGKNVSSVKISIQPNESWVWLERFAVSSTAWRHWWIWGMSSGSWRRACLLSFPSPLPFVGTERSLEQQSLFFIQIIQYIFTEHLLRARHQSAGGNSSSISLTNCSLTVDNII